MSLSKLESLPNEILIDIFEKYVNGLDIINAFAFQLNRRFDALIIQCQRHRFDFIRCHKNDFRICMGLLPIYIDKIEELSLSEQNTSGQVYAFLSFYPSFDLFKQLRKLYFNINPKTIGPDVLQIALYSLLRAPLHTLSIQIIKGWMIPSLDITIAEIFRMKTLKKLSLFGDSYGMVWRKLGEVSSNIKYLTMKGMRCQFEDLESILQCASGLQYFDIQLEHYSNSYRSPSSSVDVIPRMSMLHTALFRIKGEYLTLLRELESFLRCMPSLRRLEIIGHRGLNLHTIKIWETLLKTSVSKSIDSFILDCTGYDLQSSHTKTLFEYIQTPFWTENKNFNIIIKQYANESNNKILDTKSVRDINPYILEDPVDLWYSGPRHNLNDNFSVANEISSLRLFARSYSVLKNHYLNNVKHLVVKELNDNLFELITKNLNCSQIRHLDVTSLYEEMNRITSLLPYIKNIISLRINLDQLFDDRFIYLKECNDIKYLDISADKHGFDENHIFHIANICPNIEHLIINTHNLQNVPILQTYLPCLHSLSFAHHESFETFSSNNYKEKKAEAKLREKCQFLFHRGSYWMTVWIDETALQDTYWKNINSNLQQ